MAKRKHAAAGRHFLPPFSLRTFHNWTDGCIGDLETLDWLHRSLVVNNGGGSRQVLDSCCLNGLRLLNMLGNG